MFRLPRRREKTFANTLEHGATSATEPTTTSQEVTPVLKSCRGPDSDMLLDIRFTDLP